MSELKREFKKIMALEGHDNKAQAAEYWGYSSQSSLINALTNKTVAAKILVKAYNLGLKRGIKLNKE